MPLWGGGGFMMITVLPPPQPVRVMMIRLLCRYITAIYTHQDTTEGESMCVCVCVCFVGVLGESWDCGWVRGHDHEMTPWPVCVSS